MPVWLSLFAGIFATVGFFAAIFGLVFLVVQGKRTKGKPRLRLAAGPKKGTLSYWVEWDPATYDVEFYRLRVQKISPGRVEKESTHTFTMNPGQKAPFVHHVVLPARVMEVVDAGSRRDLICFEARTSDEFVLIKNYRANLLKRLMAKPAKLPSYSQIELQEEDAPPVMTLDYAELQVRRKKVQALEAAAAAKAAKKKPAPAPAPKKEEATKASEAEADEVKSAEANPVESQAPAGKATEVEDKRSAEDQAKDKAAEEKAAKDKAESTAN